MGTTIVSAAQVAANATKLEDFYDATKLKAIRDAVDDASDINLPAYQKSYQSFIDVLKPYTITEILKTLKNGVAAAASEKAKKVKLHENLKKLKQVLKDKIYEKLMADKAALIKKKTDFLIEQFKVDPIVGQIEQEFDKLDSVGITAPPEGNATDQANFDNACALLVTNLAKLLLPAAVPNCEEIALDPSVQAKPSIAGKISESKNKIKEQFEAFYDGVIQSVVPADSEEQKTEDDFIAAVEKLNKNFLHPTKKINTASGNYLDPSTDYTNNSLSDAIELTLRTFNFGQPDDPYTYVDVIEAYNNELNPAMTSTDIKKLKLLLETKKSPLLISKLDLVLSNSVKSKVVEPFIPISGDTLLSKMKMAALEGANNFDKAYQDVKNASDEFARRTAIIHLASFFNDNSPEKYHSKIKNIANTAQDILVTLGSKHAEINTAVITNNNYKKINAVASINAANIDNQLIKSDAPPNDSSLAEMADGLSGNMRRTIFGQSAGDIDILVAFNDLSDRLKLALEHLKAAIPVGSTGALPITKANIEPIVHAFNFVFFSLLDKLDKIPDLTINNHDTELNSIWSIFKTGYAAKYADRFSDLKSVIFEHKELPPAVGLTQRDIFTLLNSVKAKLDAAFLARPLVVELQELKLFIDSYIR